MVLAFIPMYLMGLNANIMSLAGIAISIGVLVDGAIVEVENAYKQAGHWNAGGRQGDFHEVRLEALLEVGPSVFFSLLVIAVAFLPVFTLVDQEGRLFKPLAYSKNLAMAIAAILAITLDPAMRMLFARMDPFRFKPQLAGLAGHARCWSGKYYPEEQHPISAPASPALRAALPLRPAARQGHHRRGAWLLVVVDHPGLPEAGLGVHAAACARAPSSTCPPPCPGIVGGRGRSKLLQIAGPAS